MTDDPIARYDSLRDHFSVPGPMTFQWIGSDVDPPRRLWLRMVFYARGDENELVIEFDEVALDDFSPTFILDDVRLAIRSMRERGWDTARYRVVDAGEDWLALYCKTISLTIRPISGAS
jgi:hypothetical protein